MWSWIASIAWACWRPVSLYARMSKDDDESSAGDDLVWSRDLEKHSCGEFSFAVVDGNEVIEDQSQVETSSDATFVGVYDGHGGTDASRFVCDHLFLHLMKLAREHGDITEDVLRSAFFATEEGFLTLVRRSIGIKPLMAAVGSCCLVGVIWKGALHVANLGDARAVLGYVGRSKKIVAEQLSDEHNASLEEVRKELRASHPDDNNIVVMKQGIWRVKGIIQISRSIGDAYLKRPEFALGPKYPRFHLPEPILQPVLRAEPSLCTRVLQPNDKFVIFASDGLWEHLTNQEAVEIVHNNPRPGIARRLVKAALDEAVGKRNLSYDELKNVEKRLRRCCHDDITVVVMFIDHEMFGKKMSVPEMSVRGFIDTVGPSNFSILQGIDANARFVI